MYVHLIDGTYELFRHFYAIPSDRDAEGHEMAATRGVLTSILRMLEDGVTHIGVATDHVIESFRNDLWPGYKSGEGVDPALREQFVPMEDALTTLGVAVWPMVELEADDALASAVAKAAADPTVRRVFICTPDKDLGQCVSGNRVVQLDRRTGVGRDAAGVREKFGVPPASIPDYLALVGDSADGFPGLPGWGAKSSAAVLARYGRLEAIPADAEAWDVSLRNRAGLARTLDEQRDLALLFRDLATLRTSAPVFESVEELRWTGPTPRFPDVCARLRADGLVERAARAAEGRGG